MLLTCSCSSFSFLLFLSRKIHELILRSICIVFRCGNRGPNPFLPWFIYFVYDFRFLSFCVFPCFRGWQRFDIPKVWIDPKRWFLGDSFVPRWISSDQILGTFREDLSQICWFFWAASFSVLGVRLLVIHQTNQGAGLLNQWKTSFVRK